MKVLILGSCALDIVIRVEQLPKMQEDINASSLKVSLGGMAFNVYQVIEQLKKEAILGVPLGSGKFASITEDLLNKRNYKAIAKIKELDNGCCLCIVDGSGERSFISYHGAEYKFKKEWFNTIDFNNIDLIYVSGLELEEDTAEQLVEFLKEKQKRIFFAPGPRVQHIDSSLLNRVLELSSYIHLNEIEAFNISKEKEFEKAAQHLNAKYHCNIIITLQEKGAYVYSEDVQQLVHGVKAKVKDTVGAGDSHAGAFIAAIISGKDVVTACAFANKVAAKVVEVEGTDVVTIDFKTLKEELR